MDWSLDILLLVLLLICIFALPQRPGFGFTLHVLLSLVAIVLLVVMWWRILAFIPLWLLIGFAAIAGLVVLGVALKRGERRRQMWSIAGKCEQCGYDLRSSHERCPECGADIPEELARRRRIQQELGAKRNESQAG
jgi:hypothetical protein